MSAVFVEQVRHGVDAHLTRFFEDKMRCVDGLAPGAVVVVDRVRELTQRGGKRLRPAMMVAGFRAAGGSDSDAESCWAPAAALELLQSYLLIQDDWMDQDVTRRGGPTVHVQLASVFGDAHTSASVAILASDLASAYAEELLASAPFAAERVLVAQQHYASMHQQVILGQFLDVAQSGDVETMHALKTAAYTVTGPLCIGAALAGADTSTIDALAAFGRPLGIAFQLRDDVLGTFGTSARTGKAASGDLRQKKRTAIYEQALSRLDDSGRTCLASVESEADAEAARTLIRQCGALDTVEKRIEEQVACALAALEDTRIQATDLLAGLTRLLVDRDA